METIASGVHQISSGGNAFIVDGDDGVTLVDAGLPRRHAAILAGIGAIGRKPSDVRSVVVTHAHVDHVGGLAALRQVTDVVVYASGGEAAVIRGERRPEPPPMFDRLGPIAPILARLIPTPAPTAVDVELAGSGDDLPADFTVIATPGHTVGHVSYRLEREGGIVFVGDAAVHKGGVIRPGFFNKPDATIDRSIRRLAEESFAIACFGHSGLIRTHAAAAFASF